MKEYVIRLFQKGFNYSLDGPGNWLVYHLQGCNLRCPWCSNPEGIFPEPHKAFEQSAFNMTVEEILNEIISCRPMFFDGGGVTFTGGEPTLQWKPLSALLKHLRHENINTAVETNGTHPDLVEWVQYIDTWMIDLKHYDPTRHQRITGFSNENTIQNIRKITGMNVMVHIRIPLIGTINNSPEDLKGFTDLLSTIDNDFFTVEILPYHEYGKAKWLKCGMEYTITNGFVTKESVQQFEETLKNHNITVVHT